ncbi:MAG: hypothetical protein IPP43_12925 [Chitinophagaceae bacterium]|nr:hypothetical protein [Chitinophagaceae bacterium]
MVRLIITSFKAGPRLVDYYRKIISSTKGITEVAIAFAGNRNDKFYFGWTLGIPFVNYEKEATFTEADATSNLNNKFDFARITDNLATTGNGANLKLGIIYKPVEYVRLGLAIHTPTFYMLTDRYSTEITTNTENYKGTLSQSSGIFTNNNDAEFKYWMFSPYRIMVSGSYVLREIEDVRKQKGFLTADIEYVNYKSSSYTTDPDGDESPETKAYLKLLNKTIDNTYKELLI